jgi:hypothetical protein
MAILELGKVKRHNLDLAKGGKGVEDYADVRETVEASLAGYIKETTELRNGLSVDSKGNKLGAYDISFEDSLMNYFGATKQAFMAQLGIDTSSMSLSDVASRLGVNSFNEQDMMGLLKNHSSYSIGGIGNTGQVNPEFRFIIPEMILSAIKTGYQHTSLHQGWITGTQNLSTRSGVKMPRIERADANPHKVAEGGKIPLGSVQFGQKSVGVFKVGIGFGLTKELIMESSIDMLSLFLQEVGNEMSISADSLAMDILVNGEQTDGSEAIPVVGVNTPGTLGYKDIKRLFTQMKRLHGQSPSKIIAGLEDGIDITELQEFKGFDGAVTKANIQTIIGVPETFTIDTHLPPADQMIFLNTARAMTKLSFGQMTVETKYDPSTQTEYSYVTDHIGFAIIRNDARVALDTTVDFDTAGWPAGMDVDSIISQNFVEA